MRAYSPINIACRSCGMNPATYQCVHCERFEDRPSLLCLDCARRHNEVAAFRKHELVPLGSPTANIPPMQMSANMGMSPMGVPGVMMPMQMNHTHPLALLHHSAGMQPAPSVGQPSGLAGRNAAAHYVRTHLTLTSHPQLSPSPLILLLVHPHPHPHPYHQSVTFLVCCVHYGILNISDSIFSHPNSPHLTPIATRCITPLPPATCHLPPATCHPSISSRYALLPATASPVASVASGANETARPTEGP